MGTIIETIREDLTPAQVLAIRREEQGKGHIVNINRIHSQLVEIQIIRPNRIIELNQQGRAGYSLVY